MNKAATTYEDSTQPIDATENPIEPLENFSLALISGGEVPVSF